MANFIPKSVFEGTNSDGSKFSVKEWNYGDIGSNTGILGTGFFSILFFSIFLSVIASPVFLILSLFTFNGKVQVYNILGFLVGCFFLIDMYNGWICNLMVVYFLGNNIASILVGFITGIVMVHAFLLLISFIIGNFILKKEDNNAFSLILLFSLVIIFIVGYSYGNSNVKDYGSFNRFKREKIKEQDIESKETERTTNMSISELEAEQDARIEQADKDLDRRIKELREYEENIDE